MAYNVGALTNYVKENEQLLLTSTLFSGRTQSLIQAEGNVQAGIKSSENLNIMDTDAVFQAPGCSWSPSGTTTFTNRPLVVGKISVQEALCPRDLETKYTQKALQAGSKYDSVPFEEEFTAKKAARISQQLETALWTGDTASGTGNINKFDGLIKTLTTANGSVNANLLIHTGVAPIAVATGITSANVVSIVKGMYRAIPTNTKGKEGVRIFCGWDVFELAIGAYVDLNSFNYATSVNLADGEFMIPGTSYKLTAVHGLNGTSKLYSIKMDNLYLGVDMLGEDESFEMWESKDNRDVRFSADFKMGVNVAFPTDTVNFTLIP